MDPALDGFGHHNPELTQPDDLWWDAMAIDRMIEKLFQGRDLSANKAQFMWLIRMGILDGREGYNLIDEVYCLGDNEVVGNVQK